MVYAATAKEIAARRKAFLRKRRLKCRAVADSLGEGRCCIIPRSLDAGGHEQGSGAGGSAQEAVSDAELARV
jgi:hypothetical protein